MCYLIYFTITYSNKMMHSETCKNRQFVKCTLSTCVRTLQCIFLIWNTCKLYISVRKKYVDVIKDVFVLIGTTNDER